MSTRKIPAKTAEPRPVPRATVKHPQEPFTADPATRPAWVGKARPVLLAAPTTREPLLLIGRHGTAKSFLLERLAKTLGLVYRFYNASLINYDDLVGIPLPNETQTSLRYITTPTAIWDAEVVFVDELNRTRPDLQNKLFPIIHERRVQGVELEKLRYRWAAMNPAANGDHDNEEHYLGAEPLDPALADRFGFLIEVPDWSDLTKAERTEVLIDQFRGGHEFPVQVWPWWSGALPSFASSAPGRRPSSAATSWPSNRNCAEQAVLQPAHDDSPANLAWHPCLAYRFMHRGPGRNLPARSGMNRSSLPWPTAIRDWQQAQWIAGCCLPCTGRPGTSQGWTRMIPGRNSSRSPTPWSGRRLRARRASR